MNDSSFVNVVTEFCNLRRSAALRAAVIAAAKRDVTLDASSMTQDVLDRWGLVATEDEVIAERETTRREAEATRARVIAKTKVAPDEFDWVCLTDMDPLRKRIVGFVEVFHQMREAAERVARGDLHRVLFVGPAGAGKTSAMVLFPQLVATYWAKDQYDRTIASISTRPPAEEAAEVFSRTRLVLDAPLPVVDPHGVLPRMRRRAPAIVQGQYERTFARVWEHETPIRWTTAYDLFRAAKKPQRFGEEEDHLAEFRNARMLLLDDIGGEPVQANLAPVEEVVRARTEKTNITVATTGMFDPMASVTDVTALLAPLCERYGAAVVRRIAEPGRTVVIPVGITSVSRLPAAAPANDGARPQTRRA